MSDIQHQPEQRSGALIGIALVTLLVGLVAGWVAHALLLPPGRSGTVTQYGSWTVACSAYSEPKGACTLSLPIVEKQSGTTFANLLVGRAPDGMKLAVTLPLNVYLMPGIALKVGDGPLHTYHYETCTMQGCIVAISLDDKLLQAMRSSKTAKIDFAMPTKDNKPIEISVALDGFDSADDAFNQDESARHNWWRRLLT